jgi:hypothetical protein
MITAIVQSLRLCMFLYINAQALEEEINSIDKQPISLPLKSLDSSLQEDEIHLKITSTNEDAVRLK